MNKLIILLGILGLAGRPASICAQETGDQVVVVYNTRVLESRGVAEHYAECRHVPVSQVLGLDLPETETMSRADFRERLQDPLVTALEEKNLLRYGDVDVPTTNGLTRHVAGKCIAAKIRYLVLCYGVPLIIARDTGLQEPGMDKMRVELRRNEAAVDNELACLPLLKQKYPLTGPLHNLFFRCTNSAWMSPTNGVLLVARLDGPSAAIARGLVDKALEAETNGLWGRAYFDLRGLTNGPYKIGDDWIRGAAEISRISGFETIVDENGGTFPASFPLSQVALYAGWYDQDASGPFAQPTVEFMPGAFAYHLHSFSAATIRSTVHQWVGPLLAKGATATMGCVDEPYLSFTPDITVFFARFIFSNFTFGEAAYASQIAVSWQTTVVGDPLYRPFGKTPQQLQKDLEERHSKLLAWPYLRAADLRLDKGDSLADVVNWLESLSLTRQSAVLMEKMAELYSRQGKPSSAVFALQQVLQLDPTPEQRIRVMLLLADRLISLGREPEAYDVYRQFVKQFPNYPDPLAIDRQLLALAQKLGKTDDAAYYQREINRLTSTTSEPSAPASSTPPTPAASPASPPAYRPLPQAPHAPRPPQAPRALPL